MIPRKQEEKVVPTIEKMIRMQIHLRPDEKAKLFTEAKKPKYNGSASAVLRALIKKL
jgi:hypothetical protein